MALDSNVMDHLNENLRKNRGGGLHIISEGADLIDVPILIIGLGGTGVDSVIRIKHMVNQRLNNSLSKDLPKNIEYLVFDTDKDSKNVNFKETKFSEKDDEVIIMEDAHLESTYQNLKPDKDVHISSWISSELNVRQIQNGAGGVRQVGRFLFFKRMDKIIPAIDRKLKKITDGKKSTTDKVYVFIATGISGGTGSGTFIDMPYIIKKCTENLGFSCQILGFIFLPDVNLPAAKNNDAARNNMCRNGFAALKELDYLMKLGNGGNGESFKQDYGVISVNYPMPPYAYCHLVSSINAEGINSYSKENCMEVTAETIINFIANETIKDGSSYTLNAYLSNIDANTTSYVAGISKIKEPILYNYLAIGSSVGELPLDNVLNYLAHLMFKQMYDLYTNEPLNSDLSDFLKRLNMDSESMRIHISNDTFLDPSFSRYTFDIIKNNPTIIEEALAERFDNIKDMLNKNRESYIAEFKKNSIAFFNDMFKDLKKGPYYVSKLINPELIDIIRNISNELVSQKIPSANFKMQKNQADNLLDKIKNNNPVFGLGKNAAAESYKKACASYYGDQLENLIIDNMLKAYDEMSDFLNSYNNKIFSVYTTLIDTLKNIFNDYADIKSQGIEVTTGNTTEFTWDIISTDVLVSEVELLINTDPTLKTDFADIVKIFLEELVNNTEKWLDVSEIAISEMLNKFVLDNFQLLARQSIDFYIEKTTNSTNEKNNAISKIIKILNESSEIMFPFVTSSNYNFPIFQYTSVPCDTNSFDNVVQNEMIKKSVITNRIFKLKVKHAIPLLAYRELQNYESIYEGFVGQTGVGMHLYETKEKSWAQLPSPIHEGAWYNNYTNPRIRKENDKISNTFDKAVEYGYIKWDGRNYICCYGELVDIENILSAAGISDINSPISIPDATKALNIIKKVLVDESRLEHSMKLYDVKFNDKSDVVVDYSKSIFINMPELNRKILEMVENHENILAVISKFETILDGKRFYNQFVRIVYTELIYKHRSKYLYRDTKSIGQPFFAASEIIDNEYIEYYIFNAFLQLDNKIKEDLFYRAQSLSDNSDDETYDEYKKTVKNLIELYDEKFSSIAKDPESVNDGKKKVEFYSTMSHAFRDCLKGM